MILQCPACETKFKVDASLIPPHGRDVKCARCQHKWLALPPPDEDSQPEPQEPVSEAVAEETEVRAEPMPAGLDDYVIPLSPHQSAPKPASLMPLLALAASLLLAVLGLSLLLFREPLQPVLGPVYGALGLHPTDGLALADVTFRERPSRAQARFIVEGHIVNESDAPRHLPILRVAIADARGEWILAREYESPGVVLKPGESYAFKATKLDTNFVDRVDHLLVDIGSGTELMLRK